MLMYTSLEPRRHPRHCQTYTDACHSRVLSVLLMSLATKLMWLATHSSCRLRLSKTYDLCLSQPYLTNVRKCRHAGMRMFARFS